MSAKNLEPGTVLALARAVASQPNGMKKLLKDHPKVASWILEHTLDRTRFHVSHNRMKSGPFAKGKRKSNVARNKRIVAMAKKIVAGRYVNSHDDIAIEFELSVVMISKICLDAGLRRAVVRGSLQHAA